MRRYVSKRLYTCMLTDNLFSVVIGEDTTFSHQRDTDDGAQGKQIKL